MRIATKIRIKTTSLNQIIAMIMVLLLMLFSFLSPITRSLGMVRFFTGILLMILVLDYKSASNVLPIVAFATVTLLLLFFSGRFSERGFNAPISHVSHFTALMSTAVIAEYMSKMPPRRRRFLILVVIQLLSVSVIISLYYVLRVNKYAIRYNEGYGYTMVLRFSQTYSICMLIATFLLVLFYGGKYKFKAKTRRWIFAIMVLFIVCILLSLFTTAVLLMCLSALLAIAVIQYRKNRISFYLLIILAAALIIMVLFFSDQFANFIYAISEEFNWIVRARIRGLVDILLGTDLSEYSMRRRTQLASYSLNTFLKHPILGVGYTGFGYGVIGMHQEWVDMLGTFGLLGTGLFFAVFITFLVRIYRRCTTDLDKNTFLVCSCIFFILGLLNPCLTFQVLFVLMCVAPNVSSFIGCFQENVYERKPYSLGNNVRL